MKFIVSSADLLSHLLIISRAISSKNNALPILDDFLFSVSGNTLELTASDVETTIVTSMPIEGVEGNGKIAMRSGILISTLKEFADQPLTFDINLDNLAIAIETETGHYDFNGDDADQYPLIGSPKEGTNNVTIPAAVLLSSIEKTSFCTSPDESRPTLTGIYFDFTPEMTTVVATDGHKMSRVRTTSAKSETNCSFCLPKKPTALLKSMLIKEDGDAEIQFDKKNVYFNTNNYRLVCRQIEGDYPDYNRVIPTENEFKLIVKRDSFTSILRRVSVYSNQGTNLVKLELKNNSMIVSAQDMDYSNSAEEVFSCQYEGAEMSIGFKSTCFIELLNNMDTEDIEIDLCDPTHAALLYPYNTSSDAPIEMLMLIMPTMLN